MTFRIKEVKEKTIIFEKHEAQQAVILTKMYQRQGFVIRESGSTIEGKQFYLMRKMETSTFEGVQEAKSN